VRERKAWSYSISADLCATRSRYQLSAEGAANEAINVRKLLGSNSTLCPKPPVTISTFQSMAEQPII
jgi:hypothetical protein